MFNHSHCTVTVQQCRASTEAGLSMIRITYIDGSPHAQTLRHVMLRIRPSKRREVEMETEI